MFRLVAAALVLLAAGPTVALAARPGQAQGAAVTRAAAAPPPALNIVRHKLKRGATPNYQTLEANMVGVVSYSAFSIPAVLAGLATVQWGLRPTALVYSTAVVLLATAALVAYRRVAARPPVAA